MEPRKSPGCLRVPGLFFCYQRSPGEFRVFPRIHGDGGEATRAVDGWATPFYRHRMAGFFGILAFAWQTTFLTLVLNFTKDPSSKSLRPLVELYVRDRDRMKVEVEILERQLKHRLVHFAKPDDATVRKVVIKKRAQNLGRPSPRPVWLRRRGSGEVLQCAPLDCLRMA